MKVPCAIFYGLILMIAQVGPSLLAVLVILLVRTSASNSTMQTGLTWYLELTSLSWMGIAGAMKKL